MKKIILILLLILIPFNVFAKEYSKEELISSANLIKDYKFDDNNIVDNISVTDDKIIVGVNGVTYNINYEISNANSEGKSIIKYNYDLEVNNTITYNEYQNRIKDIRYVLYVLSAKVQDVEFNDSILYYFTALLDNAFNQYSDEAFSSNYLIVNDNVTLEGGESDYIFYERNFPLHAVKYFKDQFISVINVINMDNNTFKSTSSIKEETDNKIVLNLKLDVYENYNGDEKNNWDLVKGYYNKYIESFNIDEVEDLYEGEYVDDAKKLPEDKQVKVENTSSDNSILNIIIGLSFIVVGIIIGISIVSLKSKLNSLK